MVSSLPVSCLGVSACVDTRAWGVSHLPASDSEQFKCLLLREAFRELGGVGRACAGLFSLSDPLLLGLHFVLG